MPAKMRLILFLVIISMVIPNVFIKLGEMVYLNRNRENTKSITETLSSAESVFLSVLMKDGTVQNMEVNDYLVSVLLREMPSNFEIEALKAQAVVARTYALYRIGKDKLHGDIDVCTDSACCQAYWDVDEYLTAGGTADSISKITSAVLDTEGDVICYNGALIDATYFSCSGGMTEAAVAVWGSDIPYLQAVESPGEEYAKNFETTSAFTKDEILDVLGIKNKADRFTIRVLSYTNGGGIDTISICGETIRGTTLRSKLKLNSTAITIEILDNNVFITTKGKGHRVGMSQYGANAMAQNGANYKEILSHYYCETDIVKYDSD